MITAYTYTVGYPVELGELILQEACVLMDAGDTHLSTVRLDTGGGSLQGRYCVNVHGVTVLIYVLIYVALLC